MAASPRSTVSSDLYSPSEPEQSNLPSHGNLLQADDFQAPYEDCNDDAGGSIYSDTMQGLDSPSEDVSRPSSTAGGPTLASSSGMTHKRKRDEYMQTQIGSDSYIPLDHRGAQSLPPKTAKFDSLNGGRSPWQDTEIVENPSTAKRTKPNGKDLTPTGPSKSSYRSSALPAVLWQHVFCFVPPVFLGRLLRVNRSFNWYLTSTKAPEEMAPFTRSIMQPLDAEAIWVASRRRFAPGLPRPIHGMRELEMWRILIGRNCQICGYASDADPASTSESPWEAGPGKSGVRIVWPFGIRCCGSCLHDVSQKEFELYLSTCPSFLVPAIPFAFVSTENHYVGHSLLKDHAAPSNLQMTKHFYRPGIQDMMGKFEDAKALGAASAEEWIKGLASQGKERLEDIIRWEQWESKGGLKKIKSRHPKPMPSGAVSVSKKTVSIKEENHSDRSTPQSMLSSARHEASHAGIAANHSNNLAPSVPLTSENISLQSAWNPVTQHSGFTQQALQTPPYHPRPERNIRDVNEAKAVRRAEIERRCAALNPPLTPNVLSHMESFQAAMQITQPMTDQAWHILKPRLLAQLPYAERKEKERVQQDELIAKEYRQRRQQEAQLKETKENIDREWETFQNPVRNRLGALADEVIESRWEGGRSVTKDISPKFAADVLLQVRQRFYAEISQEDEAAGAAGDPVKTDPPNGPPTRTLILENMKWLFDTKVKPLTDHFQRELFLCNGCDGNFKFYGFEGVIQHYAAKHTTELSMGNIVVHWRAEWPEHPPFNPNPSVARTAYYKVPTPSNSVQAPSGNDPRGPVSNVGYDQTSETDPVSFSQRQDSFHYSAETSTNTYTGSHQEGHSIAAPGQPYPPQTTYGGVTGYSGASNGYPSNATRYNPYMTPQPGQVPQSYGPTYPGQQPYAAFGPGQPPPSSHTYFQGPITNNHGNGPPPPYQNGALATNVHNNQGPVSDLYQRQMDEMAKHAKDVFIGIGGVKDLPGSVRIYVVIQLTVARFKLAFINEPSLSMFIDGLDHNATMRPVRSVNGLGCKTCIQSGTGAKLFTLPHLVNHFRTVHVESPQSLGYPQAPELDWKTDMIDLPDASIISKLVNAAGMTDSKLALIASVFQGYFPTPLPNLRGKTNTGPLPLFRKELDIAQKGPPGAPMKAPDNVLAQIEDPSNEQFCGPSYSTLQQSSQDRYSEPLEPPGEDEYDPHRPALLSKTGKAEPHRPARPSKLQGGLRSTGQVQSESTLQLLSTDSYIDRSYDRTNVLPNHFKDNVNRRPYESAEHVTVPHSSKSDLLPGTEGHFVIQDSKNYIPQNQEHHDEFAKYDLSTEQINGYHHTENSSNSVNPRSFNREAPSTSPHEPAHAADQFLSSLVARSDAGRSRGHRPMGDETEQRSEIPWQGSPQFGRQKKHHGEDGAHDQWPGDRAGTNRQGNDAAPQQVRTGTSDLRNGIQKATSQRPLSRTQYYEEYQLAQQAQMSLKSVRDNQSLTARYYPQQPGIHDRQGANGSVLVRPPSSSRTYQVARLPQYGPTSRSRSPNEAPAQMALYRPRSPVEEDRGDPIYRARSPLSRRQKDGTGKVVSYDFPQQARYEYIEDRNPQDAQYQPRVEYVRIPVDYEESRLRELPPRYFVPRPAEQVEPQYVRYEQAHEGERVEPVYERNGQLYHAPQRMFHEQPTRAAPSFAQDYQY